MTLPASTTLQRVVAAVVRRDDRFLVCRRPLDKRHGGLWEFPGGKISANERVDDAVARELHEELGVRLVNAGPVQFEAADPDSPFVILFIPAEVEGEPLRTEHSELTWATLAELREMALAPSDARYVKWRLGHEETSDVA